MLVWGQYISCYRLHNGCPSFLSACPCLLMTSHYLRIALQSFMVNEITDGSPTPADNIQLDCLGSEWWTWLRFSWDYEKWWRKHLGCTITFPHSLRSSFKVTERMLWNTFDLSTKCWIRNRHEEKIQCWTVTTQSSSTLRLILEKLLFGPVLVLHNKYPNKYKWLVSDMLP